MADSGIVHVVTAVPVTRTEYESQAHHALAHGTSFPASPAERQLYYRDDEHKWYIYNGSAWKELSQVYTLEAHKTSHQNGGSDEINVAGLSGELADAQPPKAHSHTIIRDADGDTKIQVEESADEDKIRMDVKGVEAFLLDDKGILTLAKQSAARAHKAAADQTIPNLEVTRVVLEAEDYDLQGEYDPVTNYRYTAKVSGLYLIIGQLDYAATVDQQQYQPRIHQNGVCISSTTNRASGTASCVVQAIATSFLAVNDYIELYTFHSAGANATLRAEYSQCVLAIAKIA